MLIGEVGNPRTGKTLMNFKIAKRLADSNPVMKFYQNYPPFNPNPKYAQILNPYKARFVYPITPAQLLRLRLPNEHDATVNLDELWKWLSSRGSGGAEINKVVGVIVFESGKNGFDINWDSQLGSSIDKWVRLMTPRFFFSKTPSLRYFRYGYVSETYHAGKKVIRLKLSKTVAEEKYYPFFNTMYNPKFATKENTPTMREVQLADNNELNDLSQEMNPPQDIPPEVEKKDEQDMAEFIEGQKKIEEELTGKTIIDGTDLMKQISETKKDVVEEGETLP